MKRAYHDILLPDGTLQQGPVVVEMDETCCLLSWYPLQQEEAFVEWVGGTCHIDEHNVCSWPS